MATLIWAPSCASLVPVGEVESSGETPPPLETPCLTLRANPHTGCRDSSTWSPNWAASPSRTPAACQSSAPAARHLGRPRAMPTLSVWLDEVEAESHAGDALGFGIEPASYRDLAINIDSGCSSFMELSGHEAAEDQVDSLQASLRLGTTGAVRDQRRSVGDPRMDDVADRRRPAPCQTSSGNNGCHGPFRFVCSRQRVTDGAARRT